MEQFKGDKRTKEYKEWKKRNEGLGDAIEKVTEATGIKKVVKQLFGDDCGCEDRRKKLNTLKPFKCFNEDEFNYFQKYYNERYKENHFEASDVKQLRLLHRRIFRVDTKICLNCNSGVIVMNRIVNDLIKIYETY